MKILKTKKIFKWCWDNWITTCKRMKLISTSYLIKKKKLTQNGSDLNVKAKTMEFLEESTVQIFITLD